MPRFAKLLIVLSTLVATIGLIVLLFQRATAPTLIGRIANPSATVEARVYENTGIVSFGSNQYSVMLRALPDSWLDTEAEVVIMNDGYFDNKPGPQVTWQDTSTLLVKCQGCRPFFTKEEPLMDIRKVHVRHGSQDTVITAKSFFTP